MDKKLLVVVTYSSDKSSLEDIVDSLMHSDVPAAHISKVNSWFNWKGKCKTVSEYKLDVLCTHDLLVDVVSVIKNKHTYEVPAIMWSEVSADDNTFAWADGIKYWFM